MLGSCLEFEISDIVELFETVLRISGGIGTIRTDCDGNYIEWSEKITHNQPTARWALHDNDGCGRYIFFHENMEEYRVEAIISNLTKRFGEPIRS